MKALSMVLGMIVLFGSAVQAHAQHTTRSEFSCVSANRYQYFHATLDTRAYDPKSGYADMLDAKMQDGYVGSDVICHTVGKPGNFGCVGYAFNVPGAGVVEVTITTDPVTNQVSLYHTGPMARGWVCANPQR